MVYTRKPAPGLRRSRRTLLSAGLGGLTALSLLAALPTAVQSFGESPHSSESAHTSGPPRPLTSGEKRASAYLDSIRDDSAKVRKFFTALPKGGDLHNHLPGAASTELLVKLAGEKGLCIDEKSMTAVKGPCGESKRPAADARHDAAFRKALVRAWSMQDFRGQGGESGHDHFFNTFLKFDAATRDSSGTMLAEVANSLARQNQSYLETMVSPVADEANKLADSVGYDKDLRRLHHKLLANGKMDRLVAEARHEADRADAQFRTAAHCDTGRPDPGCKLPVRFISQVLRESSSEQVFTQMVLGMQLAEKDSRFAAVNLVQPEDGRNALRNYRLHMRMLAYLHRVYPRAHIALHAGELTPGLVKPEELTYHIREAVRTGRAERIGHGVDLRHEDEWRRLARTMAAQDVPVEVPFTSNDQILGVRGREHPFNSYREHGVPVVLATDDPGVSRTDISRQYQHAAQTYHLRYAELKDLARASLQYAFLPGRSLWRGKPAQDGYRFVGACQSERVGTGHPRPACAELLARSPRAAAQWKQEAAFTAFERHPANNSR